MTIIGITGPTGAGKTTALNELVKLDGCIYDADAVYHQLLKSDTALRKELEERFGDLTGEDGEFQRKKLGAIVFADENALLDLNRITHAAVKTEVLRRLEDAPVLAAIDAIGLFEGNLAPLCDVTVAVTAPEEARVKRLMLRDGIFEDYARSRIRAQHREDWFRERCDYVLSNNGTLDAFATNCLAFLDTIGIMKENS